MIEYAYVPRGAKNTPKNGRACYRGRYKLPWMKKAADVALETTDKRIAAEKLRGMVREAELEHAGFLGPKSIREASTRTMTEHLADFLADIRARGRTEHYANCLLTRLTRMFQECNWQFPKDITADSLIGWRSRQTAAPKTLNDYVAAASQLLAWMHRQGRIAANPILTVGKVETRGRETLVRRAFTDDELERLLAVATPKRRIVYLFALLTGLRRNELASLRWDDVKLDAVPPHVTVRASCTKNHQEAAIRLRDDLAAELTAFRPEAWKPEQKCLNVPYMRDVKIDFEKAGIARSDSMGRRADFHALRHTFGTNLGRAGVAPRVAMELMRHSEMGLTMKTYTDARLLPSGDAVDMLPRWGERVEEAEVVLAANGTDGPIAQKPSQMPSQSGVCKGHQLSPFVATGTKPQISKTLKYRGKSHALSQVVAASQEGEKQCAQRDSNPLETGVSDLKTKGNSEKPSQPDDLAEVMAAWPSLPDALRFAVLAVVRSRVPFTK